MLLPIKTYASRIRLKKSVCTSALDCYIRKDLGLVPHSSSFPSITINTTNKANFLLLNN